MSSVGERRPSLRERRLSRLSEHDLAGDAAAAPDLSLNIPPANDDDDDELPANVPPQVAMESEILFENFLREEIEKEGLKQPDDFVTGQYFMRTAAMATQSGSSDEPDGGLVMSPSPINLESRAWRDLGRRLREISDVFAESQERIAVRQQASRVDLPTVTRANFTELLTGLFPNGMITTERIVVLFFYCSDLAICALRYKAQNYFRKFLEWSLAFIFQRICQWVYRNGGWSVVLSSSIVLVPKLAVLTTAIGAVLTILSLAYMHWKKG